MSRHSPLFRFPILALVAIAVSGCYMQNGKVFIGLGPRTNPGREDVRPNKTKAVRVLIVEESNDRPMLPAAQVSILTSKEVRQYVESKCCKGPDGKTPEFRILDKDDDVTKLSPAMQEAFKRSRPSVPWFYVTNGSKGTEGALSEDADRWLAIIKPYCE